MTWAQILPSGSRKSGAYPVFSWSVFFYLKAIIINYQFMSITTQIHKLHPDIYLISGGYTPSGWQNPGAECVNYYFAL